MANIKSNKVYFLIGICFILLSLSAVFVGVKNLDHKEARLEAELSEAVSSREKAQKDLESARSYYTKQISTAFSEETGNTSDGIEKDVEYLTKILKPMYNWNNSDEYSSARSKIVSQIGEDNLFARDVIPPLETKDVAGRELITSLNRDDLNMKCMLVDVFPAKKVKGKSAYYALISYIQYYGDDIEKQEHLTRNRQILYIIMDSENKIKSIKAFSAEDIVNYHTGHND